MSHRVVNSLELAASLRASDDDMRRSFLYCALGVVCLAVIFTVSGAYDTDGLSVPHRFCLWLTVSGLIVFQAAAIDEGLCKVAPAARFQLVVGAAAVVLTVLLMTIELHLLKYTPLLPKEPDPFLEFLVFVTPPVAIIAGLVVFMRAQLCPASQLRETMGESFAPPGRIAARPLIAGLLPPPQRSAVVFESWPDAPVTAVRAYDHYLEVWNGEERSFIRGRMKDAVMHLRAEKGLQVHRSWWVAQCAVDRVEREGRDVSLVLTCGTRVPVGRSRIKALRAAGWGL